MQLDRILVIYKKSAFQLYVQEHGENAVKKAIQRGDPAALQLKDSHRAQHESMEQIAARLNALGIANDVRWRGRIKSTQNFDLVITVGGDGTLLDAARSILDDTPLLGINSDPRWSEGLLCSGVANDLDQLLTEFAKDRLAPQRVARLAVSIDKKPFGPFLNEILFAHSSPAAMSRCEFSCVPKSTVGQSGPPRPWQRLRCSGIWVATATGSSAAIRSAGGAAMAAQSRRLQYFVREPFAPQDGQVRAVRLNGFAKPDEVLLITSRMRRAGIWGDGLHPHRAVHYGQTVIVGLHPRSLHLIRRPYVRR